jgi:hypothetical protein
MGFLMLGLEFLPGKHVHLSCCSGSWDSARRTTTWTAGGNAHSWCCCSALSHQIPFEHVESCQKLDLKFLPGWHVHLNCCTGSWESARSTTTRTAGGITHSWCCCSALSHQIPFEFVEGCRNLGLKFLPGWHVHLNCCSGSWDSTRRTTTQTAGGKTHFWCCCSALSHQISFEDVEGCQMLGLTFVPGWHVLAVRLPVRALCC